MKYSIKIIAAGAVFLFATALVHAASASENWEVNCAKCHGGDGKGQTKIGKKYDLKDYTDPAVQAKLSDADIAKAINDGVLVDGKKKMKSFKDALSADEIKDLVAYVRHFKP